MFEIRLSYIRQYEDTAGPGADEPYVIVFAADLADTGLIPVPAARSVLYGPYEMGNVVGAPVGTELCWGFDGQPRDIDDPNNPLILVALLESDHGDEPANFANSVRAGAHAILMAALPGYIVARNGGTMDLPTLRSRAIDDWRGGLDSFIGADIEHDERLGPVKRLSITANDLTNAQNGVVEKKLMFESEEEDSKYELTFRIGTGVGSASSALTSSQPTDRYAALWMKQPGPDWVARHRMTSVEYQSEFDKYVGQGFRLVHVSGYNFDGQPRFAAIWEKSGGTAWAARHNMTSGQYQKEFEERAKAEYQLAQVSGYRGNGQDLYAAIWRKEASVGWIARHRMTSGQYQQEFNKYIQEGFRLVDVSGYGVANEQRYAAIWQKQAGVPWIARHGMTGPGYQKEFNKLSAKGFQPVHVTSFRVGAQRRYAAIWEKSNGVPSVARHNMTSDQYQQEFNKYVGQGFRLACVSGS